MCCALQRGCTMPLLDGRMFLFAPITAAKPTTPSSTISTPIPEAAKKLHIPGPSKLSESQKGAATRRGNETRHERPQEIFTRILVERRLCGGMRNISIPTAIGRAAKSRSNSHSGKISIGSLISLHQPTSRITHSCTEGGGPPAFALPLFGSSRFPITDWIGIWPSPRIGYP